MISSSLFSDWSSSTDRSRLRSRHPAAAARHPAACQFCVSRLISVNSAALKSAAAITRCPSSTVRTLPCGGGGAASLHAPLRPDPRTSHFPPLLLRARAAACIMPNLFVKVQQLISCRRDPLRLRQAVLCCTFHIRPVTCATRMLLYRAHCFGPRINWQMRCNCALPQLRTN